MERVVAACKQHPWMALAQAVTGAALVFVGTTLVSVNREVGELKTEINGLKVQVARIQNAEDQRVMREFERQDARRR